MPVAWCAVTPLPYVEETWYLTPVRNASGCPSMNDAPLYVLSIDQSLYLDLRVALIELVIVLALVFIVPLLTHGPHRLFSIAAGSTLGIAFGVNSLIRGSLLVCAVCVTSTLLLAAISAVITRRRTKG